MMVRRLATAALAAPVLAVCVASCAASSDESSDELTASATSPIIQGTTSDKSQDEVVLLLLVTQDSVIGCTGTLLAPNLVLTARHCVSMVSAQGLGCDDKGNTFDTNGNPVSRSVGADHPASNILVFTGAARPDLRRRVEPAARGKEIRHNGGATLCSNDIALIVLDRSIPNAKVAPIRLGGKPSKGEKIRTVGYGVTQTKEEPNRMQRSAIAVTRVGPARGTTRSPAIPPNDFEVGESICQGDSGGPGFSEDTGAVIGVVSRGSNGGDLAPPSSCMGAKNVFTATSPFKSMIMSAFDAAGATPVVERETASNRMETGSTCTEAGDCQGGFCLTTVNAGRICSQECGESAPCPTGFSCTTKGSQSVCAKSGAAEGAAATGGAGSGCATAPSASSEPARAAPSLAFMVSLCAALGARARRRRET